MSSLLVVHKIDFDYSALAPDVVSLAEAAASEIRASTHRQITEVIAAGQRLLEVKAALPHGAFSKWLDAEFGWAERTAQNYMLAAETYGSNPQHVAYLPLKTIYQLQAPTVPESVRADVFSMAKRGERPTEVTVKVMIAEAKRKQVEERREAAEQAERAKRSLRSSKSYRDRRAAEIEAGRLEAEKRAAEQRAAAQQAAELIGKALPASQVQVLIASIEKGGVWLFNNALRELGSSTPDEPDVDAMQAAHDQGRHTFGRRDPATVLQDRSHDLHRLASQSVHARTCFPTELREAIKGRIWEYKRNFAGMTEIPPCSFHDFVHEKYPYGIGATYEIVEDLIRGSRPDVIEVWEKQTGRKVGGIQ
jgi:hypothetical protein